MRERSSNLKLLLIVGAVVLATRTPSGMAQADSVPGTVMDLRTDGRIIVGRSAEWLRQEMLKDSATTPNLKRLGQGTRTYLRGVQFSAIVVPDRPLGTHAKSSSDKHSIAVVLEGSTIPLDVKAQYVVSGVHSD